MKNSKAIDSTQTGADTDSSTEISKVAVVAFALTAGLIGLWSVACIISGIVNGGGPVPLMSNLFHTIFG